MACEVRPIEEIITPIAGCPNSLESVEFGYAHPIDRKSFILGEACYSPTDGYTQYVHMKKASVGNVADVNIKIEESDEYLRFREHPSSKYKLDLLLASRLDTLEEHLRLKLGQKKTPFIELRNYMGLNMLSTKQFMSVLKLGWNYVPVVGYEHMPNLDVLQNDLIELAGRDIDVFMGAHGVLKLSGVDNATHEIYLDEVEHRFPVPEYVWMAVVNGERAAAFAILNNPDAELDAVETMPLCDSKCSQIAWLKGLHHNELYRRVKDGHVTCCSYEDMRKRIPGMPNLDRPLALYV